MKDREKLDGLQNPVLHIGVDSWPRMSRIQNLFFEPFTISFTYLSDLVDAVCAPDGECMNSNFFPADGSFGFTMFTTSYLFLLALI